MLVLGLESSCDETAAAVVADGTVLRSNIIASQHEIHGKFGGVVPELASRAHIERVIPVVEQSLLAAGVTLDEIDAIAVTQGPGLVGSLLVALQTAKAIAYAKNIPLLGVHHIEGHLSAVYLQPDRPPFPHMALVVSGGHTSLIHVFGPAQYTELGATRDDAAGEAFDKVAKLLGLGYPGGREVDIAAKRGDTTAVTFPRSMTAPNTHFEFSFSGLKTAVLNYVRKQKEISSSHRDDICASFQAKVVEVLVRKTRLAAKKYKVSHVQVCGGVAANSGLRSAMKAAGEEDGFTVVVPPINLCTDNAAMIASAGYYRWEKRDKQFDPKQLAMSPSSALQLPTGLLPSPQIGPG